MRRGDVLAQIDPRPFQNQLRQAEGALARDQAPLASARRDYQRYQELASRNLVSRQQADDQLAVAGQAEGAVRIDQAAIQSAKLNLDYARIASPIDGVAGIRNADVGNVVHPTDQSPIVVITRLPRRLLARRAASPPHPAVLPSELVEVSSARPAMRPNRRSSGVATAAAISRTREPSPASLTGRRTSRSRP